MAGRGPGGPRRLSHPADAGADRRARTRGRRGCGLGLRPQASSLRPQAAAARGVPASDCRRPDRRGGSRSRRRAWPPPRAETVRRPPRRRARPPCRATRAHGGALTTPNLPCQHSSDRLVPFQGGTQHASDVVRIAPNLGRQEARRRPEARRTPTARAAPTTRAARPSLPRPRDDARAAPSSLAPARATVPYRASCARRVLDLEVPADPFHRTDSDAIAQQQVTARHDA